MKNGWLRCSTRWLARLLGLVLCLILQPCAHAQTVPTYRPIAIQSESATSTGLSAVYQFAANDGTYTTEAVSIADSTLGSLALGAIKGGVVGILANAAFSAALKGLGDFINEAKNEVTNVSSTPAMTCSGTVYYGGSGAACTAQGAAYLYAEALAAYEASNYGCAASDVTVVSVSPWNGDQLTQHIVLAASGCGNLDQGMFTNDSISTGTTTATVSQPAMSFSSPATDADIGRAVVAANDPSLWDAVLSNPNNGAPVETPEVVAAEDALQQQAASQIQAQTGTAPSYTSETAVNTSTTTNPAPNPSPNQQPTGCALNPEDCDIRDYLKQPFTKPSDPTLPVQSVPQPNQWSSGLPSSGVCPAPIQVSAFGKSLSISFQPMCTFAGDVRPLIVAAAYLVAVFIVVGAKAGGA